jgi:hypothetical protein
MITSADPESRVTDVASEIYGEIFFFETCFSLFEHERQLLTKRCKPNRDPRNQSCEIVISTNFQTTVSRQKTVSTLQDKMTSRHFFFLIRDAVMFGNEKIS